ncbi:hypothetical protein P7H12_16645 [Paenibacillus larvae]|nr:hypothetical protein [Paenibacillus larvae]MDT2264900.1 hypothetical protein [Paenibacillus larvae]
MDETQEANASNVAKNSNDGFAELSALIPGSCTAVQSVVCIEKTRYSRLSEDRCSYHEGTWFEIRTVKKYKAATELKHNLARSGKCLESIVCCEKSPIPVWMADITYIPTDEGWLYLASLEDPVHT